VSASREFSKRIMVGMRYSQESQLFALTSPDLPGLVLAGRDPAKLWADVPAVIKAMYKVGCSTDIEVQMEPLPGSGETSFKPLPPKMLVSVEPLRS